jgi:hypothetical protein
MVRLAPFVVAPLTALAFAGSAYGATEGAFQTKSYAAPVAIILSLVLFLVFFDPRRPFRILHFDLLVLLAFAVPHGLYRSGNTSFVALATFPLLTYLLGRMLWIGFRPRRGNGPLLPIVPVRVVAIVLVLLIGLRIGLNIDSDVSDVGYASVVGAHRVWVGQPIYEGDFPALVRPGYASGHGDTYGPATYYAYVPFERAFRWSGTWDSLPAAHAAAIAFDLLTIVGLFLLGRALEPRARRLLGLSLAFAWAAYPYSLLVLLYNTNDALVSLFLVWTLVLVRSPPGRAAALALGAASKLVPLALAPLFAVSERRRLRDVLLFAVVFLLTVVALVFPLLPDGGVREFYDRTLGYQVDRESVFTIWDRFPALDPARPVALAAAAVLAFLVALLPRKRTPIQIAALGAAVLIALQLAHAYWFVLYIPWWCPFVFAALLGPYALNVRDDLRRS